MKEGIKRIEETTEEIEEDRYCKVTDALGESAFYLFQIRERKKTIDEEEVEDLKEEYNYWHTHLVVILRKWNEDEAISVSKGFIERDFW